MTFPKPTKIRSKKITGSAKGERCTLRIPGVCNGNPNTVVFAHLPGNKGTGTKNHDIFGVYSCSSCHDWLDGRRYTQPWQSQSIDEYQEVLRALQETQLRLYEKGLITIE